MKMLIPIVRYFNPTSQRNVQVNDTGSRRQSGVVLIIALILLVVISLLAVTSLRNAGSSESIAGNVRTTELANQAAEIALRHCESSTIQLATNIASTDPAFYTTDLAIAIISSINSVLWQSTSTWDSGTSTATYILPTSTFPVGSTTTYKRSPECMVELVSGTMPTGTASVTPSAFVITARGFGPEVAAGTGRPQGSVVWLQSTIEIQ
ncbi:MAG: PilX N-terminal domain-containing pilus assembly protein [Rhodoferax sp.]|uniref:pilus assembly PilX family protein n=1 Tax=Rhodoferax sp. TaxID=50421 RepID=UPI003017AF3B